MPNVLASLPMRGVWIEIGKRLQSSLYRSSLPMRGVWIEMDFMAPWQRLLKSLPMRGVWIEIGWSGNVWNAIKGHSPCGECGLKSVRIHKLKLCVKSLPMRGVWIEIQA